MRTSYRVRISVSSLSVGEIKVAITVYRDRLLSAHLNIPLTRKSIRKSNVHVYRRILRVSLPKIYC